ncbi:MAG: peptidylprolyl isomerase [Acidiferrobacterales bacterium]
MNTRKYLKLATPGPRHQIRKTRASHPGAQLSIIIALFLTFSSQVMAETNQPTKKTPDTILTIVDGKVVENADQQTGVKLDSIMTIVNNDVITVSELEFRLKKTREQLASRGITPPAEALLRKQVLERFILERIQLQTAKKIGLNSNDQDIERAINSIAKKNNISHETLLKKLQDEKIDMVFYREKLGRQIIIQKLSNREVNRRVRVSEVEIDLFIENRNRQLGGSDAYNLSQIMIPIPENASSDAIAKSRKLAKQVLDKLNNGANFSSMATGYSKSKEALNGGRLGWRSAGQLPELFVKAISSLEPDQITGILRSPNGFHILKIHEKRLTKASKNIIQTRARHILLKTSTIRSERETLAKLEELKERIASGESFATLARAYSDDSLSAAKGGDLGWLSPGQTVPRFEKAMTALPINKMSDPVKSNFGFHLIEVLERREKDIGEQIDRRNVRTQLSQRKADELYQQWIRRLRDEAFVRYVNQDVNS